MASLRFLFLDLNSYFASVEQQECPDLRGDPIIVVPVMTDATCAIAASYEAKAYGIKTGTPVYEAKQRCPGLKIVLARHDMYVDYHQRILACVERILPIYSIASIDEFACELKGSECEEGEARAIALRIKQALHDEIGAHVRCSIGIAPNRYLAKVATDLQKPDGLTVIHAHNIYEKLKHLVPRDLPGIGYNMAQRLVQSNITTFTDLWQLSPKHMRTIWHSVAGEQMYYKLRGLEIADQPTQKSTIGHSHILAPEWRPRERAFHVAQRLTLKAASRLRRSGYRAKRLVLSARIENGARLAYEITFEEACDNHAILRALTTLWQMLCGDTERLTRFKKVSVTLMDLVAQSESGTQGNLFNGEDIAARARRERVSDAMDSINARFGRDTVLLGNVAHKTGFTGTKIAFSRVPDKAEFHE